MLIQKIQKKSPIHENTNAKITCDLGHDRCRIASARLEKGIFVKTHLHTSPIVVKMLFILISFHFQPDVSRPADMAEAVFDPASAHAHMGSSHQIANVRNINLHFV